MLHSLLNANALHFDKDINHEDDSGLDSYTPTRRQGCAVFQDEKPPSLGIRAYNCHHAGLRGVIMTQSPTSVTTQPGAIEGVHANVALICLPGATHNSD